MSLEKKTFGVPQLVLAAILTAVVVVLQILANVIQPIPGVSLTFVLVPVVIGAALLGPLVGLWLGLVFGAVVLLSGGATAFLAINAPGTVITVLVKGAMAGLCAGLAFKLLEKVNIYVAVIVAAAVCPIVNTGLFCIGCRLFFWETLQGWAQQAGYENAAVYVVLGLAGINFLIELGINMLLAPVILRLVELGKKLWAKNG